MGRGWEGDERISLGKFWGLDHGDDFGDGLTVPDRIGKALANSTGRGVNGVG